MENTTADRLAQFLTSEAEREAKKKAEPGKLLQADMLSLSWDTGADYFEGLQVLPLRPIELKTMPQNQNAIAISGDGVLAVAGDDSLHVLVPLFPGTQDQDDERNTPKSGSEELSTESQDSSARPRTKRVAEILGKETDPKKIGQKRSDAMKAESQSDSFTFSSSSELDSKEELRSQFSQSSRHFPVAAPPHNVAINRHLYTVLNITYPFDAIQEAVEARLADLADDSDPDHNDIAEIAELAAVLTQPLGAGSGAINSVAGGPNVVLDIQWSPNGLGRNRRPVLAVMTSSGIVTLYGDGVGRASNKRDSGYDLSDWKILWAVGERFIVPPQSELGECIVSFAWARELGLGQALLAYATDDQEIVILAIKRVTVLPDNKGSKEQDIWKVHESARFDCSGPHRLPSSGPVSCEFVPWKTAYGLSWGPWLEDGGKMSCLLSYVARNYVGFRKITVDVQWPETELPQVQVDAKDLRGLCQFMSANAFVKWEDAIWDVGKRRIARCLIATPLAVKNFEINLLGDHLQPIPDHPVTHCDTESPPKDDAIRFIAPIVGLIVHVPDMDKPTEIPLYTCVRNLATHHNERWFETTKTSTSGEGKVRIQNTPLSYHPQWHKEIHTKINVSVPAYTLDDSSDFSKFDLDLDSPVRTGSPTSGPDSNPDDALQFPPTHDIPTHDVYLHNARIWGLCASPTGDDSSSAILVSWQTVGKQMDRAALHTWRSTVLFGWTHRSTADPQAVHPRESVFAAPSTEGRMWDWMYGAGPGVAGISITRAYQETDADWSRAHVRDLLKGTLVRQRCVFCQAWLEPKQGMERHARCVGRFHHVFERCAASGVAIMMPGVARACGVCGRRSLPIRELVKLLPEREADIREDASDDTCGCCGGKFVD